MYAKLEMQRKTLNRMTSLIVNKKDTGNPLHLDIFIKLKMYSHLSWDLKLLHCTGEHLVYISFKIMGLIEESLLMIPSYSIDQATDRSINIYTIRCKRVGPVTESWLHNTFPLAAFVFRTSANPHILYVCVPCRSSTAYSKFIDFA